MKGRREGEREGRRERRTEVEREGRRWTERGERQGQEHLAVRRRRVCLANAGAVQEGTARDRGGRPRAVLDSAVERVGDAAWQRSEDGLLKGPLVIAAKGHDCAISLLLLEQTEQAAGALLLISLAEGNEIFALGSDWSQHVESPVAVGDIKITFQVYMDSGTVQLLL